MSIHTSIHMSIIHMSTRMSTHMSIHISHTTYRIPQLELAAERQLVERLRFKLAQLEDDGVIADGAAVEVGKHCRTGPPPPLLQPVVCVYCSEMI